MLKAFKRDPKLEEIMGFCHCSKCLPAHFEKEEKILAGTDDYQF